jgi:hypothetical protein
LRETHRFAPRRLLADGVPQEEIPSSSGTSPIRIGFALVGYGQKAIESNLILTVTQEKGLSNAPRGLFLSRGRFL